jgi:hypothetical protein
MTDTGPIVDPPKIHNKPPLVTADELSLDNSHIEAQVAAIRAKLKDLPTFVEDDADVGTIGAVIVEIREIAKRAEAIRETTKEPFLTGGRVVDSYFGAIGVELVGEKDKKSGKTSGGYLGTLTERNAKYLRRKEDEARQKLEEERRKQEEAARIAKAAAEAAQRRLDDERRAREAEAAAAEAKRRQEQEAREAEARETEHRRQQEETRRQAEIDAADAAERSRLEEEAAIARRRQALADAAEADRRRLEQEGISAAQRAADAAARQAEAAAQAVARESQRLADQAEADAAAARKAADATPAELSRTRTDAGTASLKRKWTFEILEPAEVDVSQFASYITEDMRKTAIKRFVDDHKDTRQLKGVKIYQDLTGQFT